MHHQFRAVCAELIALFCNKIAYERANEQTNERTHEKKSMKLIFQLHNSRCAIFFHLLLVSIDDGLAKAITIHFVLFFMVYSGEIKTEYGARVCAHI